METLSRTRGDAPSVIAYDRRGFTQAAPDPAPSMRVNADDAAALLEHLDAVPAHVLGWSAGGLVATCLAIEHPHTVRSLTLVEPSLHGLRNVTPSALAATMRARVVKLRRGQRAATDLMYGWTFGCRDCGASTSRPPLLRMESAALHHPAGRAMSFARRDTHGDIAERDPALIARCGRFVPYAPPNTVDDRR